MKKQQLMLCLIIILVVALGLLAINQFTGWYYKMELLKSPCDLCIEANPNLEFRVRPEFIMDPNNIIINFSIP